jgi:hypothetical protein
MIHMEDAERVLQRELVLQPAALLTVLVTAAALRVARPVPLV